MQQDQDKTDAVRRQDPAALEELIKLAARLNQAKGSEETVALVTESAAGLFKAGDVFLYMLNPKTRETIRTIHRQSRKTADAELREIETNTGGWIMQHSRSLLSPDLLNDERFRGIKLKIKSHLSAMGIPLMSESAVIGSLVLIDKLDGTPFTSPELELLELLGQVIAPFMRMTQQFQAFFVKPVPDSLLLDKYARLGLLGKSGAFVAMLKAIEAAARCDVRILLQGASGTGKELVARAIHQVSGRWSGPFMAIDCGAIPPSLVESELMGHVRGAFTGAHAERKGLIVEADHGTLFMDEVANLPLEMQSKLLRVLQEGEVRPVGGNRNIKVDVRIIAAASSSLEERVRLGQFREDLYYRLYVFPILVPSLGERQEDIGLLADHFLKKFAARQNKQVGSFQPEIIDLFKRRLWRGNIRELENVVERLVTLAPVEVAVFGREFLPAEMQAELKGRLKTAEEWEVEPSLAEQLDDYEALLIRQALEQHAWNQSRAARALKIPVQTLHSKIERLQIARKNNRQP